MLCPSPSDCHPAGICHTKVKVRFNLGPHLLNQSIKYLTHLHLPIDNIQVTGMNAPNPITLFTFDGPSVWLTRTQDKFDALIFGQRQSITEPYSSNAPCFDDPEPSANKLKKEKVIKERIQEVAYLYICREILFMLCPNSIADPISTTNQIK